MATHISVTAPATAFVGASFTIKVVAVDASNKAVTSYSGTVHFTSSDPQAVLSGDSTLTNGSGTFSASLTSLGNQTIMATDTVTATITGGSNQIDIATSQSPVAVICTMSSRAAGSSRPNCSILPQELSQPAA